MKTINTSIRHALTYLAGLGGFLYQHGMIDASGVDAANQAGAALVDPLAIIWGLIAAVVMRFVIFLLGKIFPGLSESATADPGQGENGSGAGWPLPLLVTCVTAGLMGLGLSSCTPAQIAAARAIPVKACVVTPQGRVCYSTAEGLEADIDASGK